MSNTITAVLATTIFLLAFYCTGTVSGQQIACVEFCDCTSGTYVNCMWEDLGFVPLNFPPATTSINLAYTGITTVYSDSFTGLTELVQLTLSFNPLAVIEPNAFSGLEKLEQLVVSGTQLTTLPPGLFYRLFSLTTTYLSANMFSVTPPSTRGLSSNPIPCHFSCWTCDGPGGFGCTLCADDKLPVGGSCEAVEISVSSLISASSALEYRASALSIKLEDPEWSTSAFSSISAFSVHSSSIIVASEFAVSAESFSAVFESSTSGIFISSTSAVDIAPSLNSVISVLLHDPSSSSGAYFSISAFSVESLFSIESINLRNSFSSSPFIASSISAYSIRSRLSVAQVAESSSSAVQNILNQEERNRELERKKENSEIIIMVLATSLAILFLILVVVLYKEYKSRRNQKPRVQARGSSPNNYPMTSNSIFDSNLNDNDGYASLDEVQKNKVKV